MGDASSQKNYAYLMAESVKRYLSAIGFGLVFFGVADLWFVMPNLYAGLIGDWPNVDWRFIHFYMPQWRITVPILLIMTLSGTLMLSLYCIRGIKTQSGNNKQYAAILVTALGFTYQVIGAWPLWNQQYAWPWQAEIARYGNWLVFPLYIGSLIALIVGAGSLYFHSKIYKQKNTKSE